MPLPPPESGAFGVIWTIGFYGIFGLIIAAIIYNVVKSVDEANYNNSQPHVKVTARILNRREQLSGGGESSVRTTYFCTFELSGDVRVELKIPAEDFGLMVEGDRGTLEYQGRRFYSFTRERTNAVEST